MRAKAALIVLLLSLGLGAGCDIDNTGSGHTVVAGYGSCVATLKHWLNGGEFFHAETIEHAGCVLMGARLEFVPYGGGVGYTTWNWHGTHAESWVQAPASPKSQHFICQASNDCGYGEA